MNKVNNLPNEQIHEIAENIDMGEVCYINVQTGETIFMMNNAIIHNCEYRENWFAFKQNALEEYVRNEIGYR